MSVNEWLAWHPSALAWLAMHTHADWVRALVRRSDQLGKRWIPLHAEAS